MLVLKYLLMILGIGLFGSASALVVYDIYLSAQLRRLLRRNTTDESGANLFHFSQESGSLASARRARLAPAPTLSGRRAALGPGEKSGLRARTPRKPLRNHLTLRANFPGATAGQGLR